MRVLKGNRSFFFLCWFHWFFCNFWWFHDFFCKKTWNLGWFHEMRKSKILKPIWCLDWVRGLKLALRSGLRSSPRTQSRHQIGFQYFLIFRISWIPPKVFKFSCKKIVNTIKNFKKSMKYRTKNKKNKSGLRWNPSLVIFWTKIQPFPPNYAGFSDLVLKTNQFGVFYSSVV